MPTNGDQAPGLDAINQALTSFYGQKSDRSFSENELTGTGSSALESISVYRSQSERPHWHYITFGFSELFEKESEDPDLSGLGFELTFRLVVSDNETSPPRWPCDLLNDLAREIFENATHLQPGNNFEFQNPINMNTITRLNSVLIARDSELGTIETKFGKVQFLQVVGITADELNILRRWRADKFIEAAKTKLGKLLLTDLNRDSIADDPCVALQIEEGITADGTGDIVIDCPVAEWIFTYKALVSLGTDVIAQLQARLVEGISGKRDIVIRGSESTIVFRNGKEANFKIDNDVLIFECTVSDAQTFASQLQAVPSSYTFANLPVAIAVVDAQNPGLMLDPLPTKQKSSSKKTRK